MYPSKSVSQYVVSKVLPSAMMQMDAALKDVKTEMLKGVKGRLLDLGAGGGSWVAYYAKNEAVEHIIALEPNTNLHSTLRGVLEKEADRPLASWKTRLIPSSWAMCCVRCLTSYLC